MNDFENFFLLKTDCIGDRISSHNILLYDINM